MVGKSKEDMATEGWQGQGENQFASCDTNHGAMSTGLARTSSGSGRDCGSVLNERVRDQMTLCILVSYGLCKLNGHWVRCIFISLMASGVVASFDGFLRLLIAQTHQRHLTYVPTHIHYWDDESRYQCYPTATCPLYRFPLCCSV